MGYEFILRGEYTMIDRQDNQTIGRPTFIQSVHSGMECEMSIVMRHMTGFNKKCPECGYFNDGVETICGWTKWQVPIIISWRCLTIIDQFPVF